MTDETHERLSPQLRHHVELAKENGAVLQLVDYGLSLNKGASGTQSVSDMAGLCPILHLNEVVARLSRQIML